MARSKKQITKKFQGEPKYMSVIEAAFELQVSETIASRFFDEAAADGVELLQFNRSKRVNRKGFWAWIQKNRDISVPSVTFS